MAKPRACTAGRRIAAPAAPAPSNERVMKANPPPLAPPSGPEALTGLVLAGGQATRMGGADKGLLGLKGRPMAAWVLERLAPQVGALAVNANRNGAAYAALGVPVWPDRLPGLPGPLAGWHAGLAHATTPWVLTVPCDAPRLPHDLAHRLVQAVTRQPSELALAVCPGEDGTPTDQPVFALLHCSLLPALEAALAQGQRGVARFAQSRRTARAVFSDAAAFANVNTPEQLQALEALLQAPE